MMKIMMVGGRSQILPTMAAIVAKTVTLLAPARTFDDRNDEQGSIFIVDIPLAGSFRLSQKGYT